MPATVPFPPSSTGAILGIVLALSTGPAWGQAPQRIAPPTAEDIRLVRPLADRGAAALVYFPDGGPEARVTVVIPVHAPIATVHRVLVDAAAWPTFIPAFSAVEVLSRSGRRAAYRFTANGPMLDVTATCTLQDLSLHRVDLTVQDSAFGPAGARWDLTEESPGETLVTLTNWSDPSQGHWLLRRAAASNPSATAGMNLAVDLALALAVARRSAIVAGASLPPHAPPSPEPPSPMAPPPPGPWIALNPRYYVVAFTLSPEGAVTEMSLTGQTWASPAHVQARIEDVSHYADHLPGVFDTRPLEPAGRFSLRLDGTWDRGAGEVIRTVSPDGAVLLDGVSGELSHAHWRWNVTHDPQHGTLLWLSGGVEAGFSSLLTAVATAREPLLLPGLSALRKLVWLRYMLNGV